MQVDPIETPASDPSDLNLYSYVGNDPLNATDPLGLMYIAREFCVETGSYGEVDSISCEWHLTYVPDFFVWGGPDAWRKSLNLPPHIFIDDPGGPESQRQRMDVKEAGVGGSKSDNTAPIGLPPLDLAQVRIPSKEPGIWAAEYDPRGEIRSLEYASEQKALMEKYKTTDMPAIRLRQSGAKANELWKWFSQFGPIIGSRRYVSAERFPHVPTIQRRCSSVVCR
jgi:hypothetical protein